MILQGLNKIKQTTVMYSIVLIVIGIVMIMCPVQYTDSFILILGILMMITAGVMSMDFFAGKKEAKDYVLFAIALFFGIMSLAIMFYSDSVLKIIGWTFGVLLVIDGLHTLLHAFMYARKSGRKGWWLLIIFSALIMLSGLIIFNNPWWDTPTKLFEVIGGAMMIAAIVGLLRLLWLWPVKDA